MQKSHLGSKNVVLRFEVVRTGSGVCTRRAREASFITDNFINPNPTFGAIQRVKVNLYVISSVKVIHYVIDDYFVSLMNPFAAPFVQEDAV